MNEDVQNLKIEEKKSCFINKIENKNYKISKNYHRKILCSLRDEYYLINSNPDLS